VLALRKEAGNLPGEAMVVAQQPEGDHGGDEEERDDDEGSVEPGDASFEEGEGVGLGVVAEGAEGPSDVVGQHAHQPAPSDDGVLGIVGELADPGCIVVVAGDEVTGLGGKCRAQQ